MCCYIFCYHLTHTLFYWNSVLLELGYSDGSPSGYTRLWVKLVTHIATHDCSMYFNFTLKSSDTWGMYEVSMQQDNAQIEPLQMFPLQRMSSHLLYVIITLHVQCRKWSKVLGYLHLMFVSPSGCPSNKGCIIATVLPCSNSMKYLPLTHYFLYCPILFCAILNILFKMFSKVQKVE